MKTLSATFIIFSLISSSAFASNCIGALNAEKHNKKPLSDFFKIEAKELRLKKDADPLSVLSFTYKSPQRLSSKDEEKLYYRALIRYDDFLAKGICSASTKRVFFLFPKTSLTISVNDLTRIRKEKRRPAWEAHALLRSQVTHEKR